MTTLSVILKKLFIFTFMLNLRLFSKPIEMPKHLHGRCKCCFYFYFSYFFFLFFLPFVFIFNSLPLLSKHTLDFFFFTFLSCSFFNFFFSYVVGFLYRSERKVRVFFVTVNCLLFEINHSTRLYLNTQKMYNTFKLSYNMCTNTSEKME